MACVTVAAALTEAMAINQPCAVRGLRPASWLLRTALRTVALLLLPSGFAI